MQLAVTMKLAAAQILPGFHPHSSYLLPHSLPTAAVAFSRRPRATAPITSASDHQYYDDDGIPIEHVKVLAKFKSRHNYIRVLQVSRAADHPLAGSRLLLLDNPGNIHSVSFFTKSLTDCYFDVFATLPPILPPGPIGVLGFGAGSAARIILELYPNSAVVHGWELDPSVLSVAREYFGLDRLETKYTDRLFIHTGNALNASVRDGFAGVLVDLFSKGRVIPELQDAATWEKLKRNLRYGGRMMVNVGGRCVEPEDKRKEGGAIMEETLEAMHKVFPGELFVLSIDDRKDSAVALTGELPEAKEWKKALKRPLRFYVDMWEPYSSRRNRSQG